MDFDVYAAYLHCDSRVYCQLARNSLCPSYGWDYVTRDILIKRWIMSLRDCLYLLGVMVLIFAAEVTGHWDYLGHMLDGAVIMFLYLKGKEK